MTFRETVLAYLTGWLLVHPLYMRAYNAWRKRQLLNPSEELLASYRDQATAVVDALEQRVVFTEREVRRMLLVAHMLGFRQSRAGGAAPSTDELMDEVLTLAAGYGPIS
jgi:hypothetical protein